MAPNTSLFEERCSEEFVPEWDYVKFKIISDLLITATCTETGFLE